MEVVIDRNGERMEGGETEECSQTLLTRIPIETALFP